MDAWLTEDMLMFKMPVLGLGTEIEVSDSFGQAVLSGWRGAKFAPEYYVSSPPGLAVMTIKARRGLRWNYQIWDESKHSIGALRGGGFLSVLVDSWEILDSKNAVIGQVQLEPGVETIHGHVVFATAGGRVATITPVLNLSREVMVTFSGNAIDRRLLIAVAIVVLSRGR
jgi:hypothetical protein